MKGELERMGRYKVVSGEMPAARLDTWYEKVLKEHEEMTFVSHTEVAGSPPGVIRATFIFSDPIADFETNMDLSAKAFGLDDDDEPDVDVEGPDNVLQTEGWDPADLDITGGC